MEINSIKSKAEDIIKQLEADGDIKEPIKEMVHTKALELFKCIELLELNNPNP